jgi:hypothetical protein
MGSFRKASLIIEQRFSPSSLHLIRLIRAIRGLTSGPYDLDLQFEEVTKAPVVKIRGCSCEFPNHVFATFASSLPGLCVKISCLPVG